jgi:putative Holliday junction resolvase
LKGRRRPRRGRSANGSAKRRVCRWSFWDERFTTEEAESALWNAVLTHKMRKARRDRVAAQILLQAYLDAGCPPEQAPLPLDNSANEK